MYFDIHIRWNTIDPVSTLAAQVRKVRPGGLVYVTQPSFLVFRFQESEIFLHDCVYPAHLHYFSPISALKLLNTTGLELIKFFSVTDTESGRARYASLIDRAYADMQLIKTKELGEPARGELNKYPWFTGLDATIYTRVRRGKGFRFLASKCLRYLRQ